MDHSIIRSSVKALAYLLCIVVKGFAQQPPTTSLEAIIGIAQQKSIRSKLAQTRKQLGLYQYQVYQSELKPQISIYGNLPGYSKQFATVTQPDGTISFEPIQQSLSSFGVGLVQRIPFTGGEISFSSDLNRFRDVQNKNTLYNGTPFYVRLQQPLFAVNPLKWQKKIEPLKLKEADLSYPGEMLSIAAEATSLFFEVLQAQNDAAMATVNHENTAYNYALEQKRIPLGTTGEDKLLQLELQVLNSRQQMQQAQYQYEMSTLSLRNLLGTNDTIAYNLEVPEKTPELTLKLDDALTMAHDFRPEFVAFERKRLEAAQQVAEARAARQQVNLIASYGLNGADNRLNNVFTNTQSQQMFSVGFNVPIVNWGRRAAALNTAEALQLLTEYTNAIDRQNYDQQIITLYNSINLLRKNIDLAASTDNVAARRYQLCNQLYRSGKLSITDLNISQVEKDAARRDYISALRKFWEAWYTFKRVTGWKG